MPNLPATANILVPSPEIVSFLALPDNNVQIPPDVAGAVGFEHLMTMLNTEVRIQNRAGTSNLVTKTLNQFWTSTNTSSFTRAYDPQVCFDPYGERWIASAMADFGTTNSSILVGVSLTSDPTGSWNLRRIRAYPDGGSTSFLSADRPSLGFNKKWIAVQANMITNTGTPSAYADSRYWVFDKTNLYAGSFTSPTVLTNTYFAGNECPAVTLDPDLETLPVLQALAGNVKYVSTNAQSQVATNYYGWLRMLCLTGSIGSEGLDFASSSRLVLYEVRDEFNWADLPPTNQFAPQAGISTKIDLVDARLQNVLFRDNKLWCTHTVFLPAENPTRSAIQWWNLQYTTSPTNRARIFDRDRIDDSSGTTFYGFPTLAVNRYGDMLIGYSRFSSNEYASACATFYPANFQEEEESFVVKAGESPYWKTKFGSINRWGDYSTTVVDPANDVSFWTLQEYAATASSTNYLNGTGRWGTYWAKVSPFVSTNDTFANPVTLSGLQTTNTGLFARTSKEPGEIDHLTNSALCSAWLNWTAPAAGQVSMQASGDIFPPHLAVYTGSSATNLVRVGDSMDGSGSGGALTFDGSLTGQAVVFNASSNTVYRIAIVGLQKSVGDYTVRLNESTAPLITGQPSPVGAHIIEGDPVKFSGMAIGNPVPSMQWQYSSNATTWSNLSGGTSTNWSIASVQSTNDGYYRFTASSTNGTATSESARLVYFGSAATGLTNTLYANDSFQVSLDEVSGYLYAIEASTNFVDWTVLSTNQVPFSFTNSVSTNYPFRFFRTRFVP